jgi:RNA polymerase sigma factor (sigma-70 family)
MATGQLDTLLHHVQKLAAGPHIAPGTDRQLLDAFITSGDEAAFATLVARHGPMVLRVCRRVLDHEQDAEDAFQATFLVLARQTTAIRKAEALAGWLHGVAYRTALKAKRSTARRRKHEARLPPPTPPKADPTWKEVRSVLDEEIQLLPEHYRTIFTLCVLEGKGVPEAAAELGCKLGTVSCRLTRARQQLQQRLARRGIELATLLAAMSVAESGRAGVPEGLAQVTIQLGLRIAAGASAAATIPSHVAQVATGVTRTMFLTKAARITMAVLLAVALVAVGRMGFPQVVATEKRSAESQKPEIRGPRPAPAATKERTKPPPVDDKGPSVEVSGRVVDPDGKLVAGAKVFFARNVLAFLREPPSPPPPSVTTDDKGRFRFRVSKTGHHFAVERAQWLQGIVVGVAPGYGPGWVYNDSAEKLVGVTIKLLADVPIQGRVLDLEGKPVAGVSVRVRSYHLGEGDLKKWVEALQTTKEGDPVHSLGGSMNPAYQLGLARPVVTGADGKFRLTGVGAERVVILRFEGPTIAISEVYVVTRPCPTIAIPVNKKKPGAGKYVYHGPTFDHVVAPTMPIIGTVRAKDTGKPLAGVTIRTMLDSAYGFHDKNHYIRTTTDAAGNYRIVGLPRRAGHYLWVAPAPGQPYLPAPRKTAGVSAGVNPLRVDFELKRGVLIRGRVTDKGTGQPVPAVVEYFAFEDNPHYKAGGVLWGNSFQARTASDGSFMLPGLPGRGLLAAKASFGEFFHFEQQYLMNVGADKIKGPIITHDGPWLPWEFNTVVEISPAQGAALRQDISLVPNKQDPQGGKNRK